MLTLTPITKQYVSIDVAGALASGAPAVISGVDVALVEPRSAPSGTTVWVASTYASGTATVLVAGYDADPTGALVVPAGQGADLWIRVVDSPEVTATRVMRVIVEPGEAEAVTATAITFVRTVAGLSGDVSADALAGTISSHFDAAGAAATAQAAAAQKAANLSDLASVSAARTNLGLGSAATQATSAFDPAGSATSAVAAEVTRANAAYDAAGAAATVQAASLQKASNLSDLASATTARTNLGLGTAATQPSTAFDASGAATTAQAFAIQRANHTGTQAATTITGLATVATSGSYSDLSNQPILSPNNVTSGESSCDRDVASAASLSPTSGTMWLSYFTAVKTETITQIGVNAGSTGATGLTLCRYALYTADGSGNLTLVASTASDTTLLVSANVWYPKALSASYSKVAGTRYAIGVLQVGTTPAKLLGVFSARGTTAPRLLAGVSGQSDLPSSVAVGSLTNVGARFYAEVLP